MKRYLKLFAVVFWMCIVMLGLMAVTGSAATVVDSGTCGENLTWVIDGNYTLIISGTGDMDNYTEKTEAPWTDYGSWITGIVIEEGVTSIGDYAFYNSYYAYDDNSEYYYDCYIIIPSSITSIGKEAFVDLSIAFVAYAGDETQKAGISIGENNSALTDMKWCNNADRIFVSDSVIYNIHDTYAEVVRGLDPNTPDYYQQYWDIWCLGILDTVQGVPVTHIDEYAFSGVYAPFMIATIPTSIKYIGDKAFRSDTQLCYHGTQEQWEEIVFADGYAPATCRDKLVGDNIRCSVDAENRVATLSGTGATFEYYDFWQMPLAYCSGYDAIVFEEGITEIKYGFFWGVTAKTLELSSTVKELRDAPFQGNCIEEIIVDPDNLYYKSVDGVLFNKDVTTLVAYPYGKAGETYCIPNTVTAIGDMAFSEGQGELSTLVMPASVTSIETYCFYDSNITDIFYLGTEEQWNEISYKGSLGDIRIHFCGTPVTSVALNKISENVDVLETMQVSAIVSPSNASYKRVSWTSSNEAVATVDASGKVTALAEGKAVITAKTVDGGFTASCIVNVSGIILASGSCGDNLTWQLTDAGRLHIIGSGAMTDYAAGTAPWNAYASFVEQVKFGKEITYVGNYAFDACSNLSEAYYAGKASQWTAVTVGENNEKLASAAMTYGELEAKKIEIENLTKADNITFTANLTSPDRGLLIVARYGENGKNLGMKIYTAAAQVPVSIANDCETVKVMWWDGFFTMRILAPVVELDI